MFRRTLGIASAVVVVVVVVEPQGAGGLAHSSGGADVRSGLLVGFALRHAVPPDVPSPERGVHRAVSECAHLDGRDAASCGQCSR